jgi:hypothetical protein
MLRQTRSPHAGSPDTNAHPQPITHAIHDNDRAIIVGQLLRPRLDLDFDYIRPAMVDRDRQRDIPIDRYGDLMRAPPSLRHVTFCFAADPLPASSGISRVNPRRGL